MFNKSYLTVLIFSIQLLLVLAACEDTQEAEWRRESEQRQAEREAAELAAGNAAVAACIETKCSDLFLDDMLLDDFTVLNQMPHVTALMASGTNIEDLRDISGMTQLKELHIRHTGIENLDGLETFTDLTLLHLSMPNGAADIAPVASLTSLTELVINGLSSDDDVSFVRDMHGLQNLILDWGIFNGGGVMSLEPLRGHPSLRNVEISGRLPEDHSMLAEMPQLQSIVINTGSDLEPAVLEVLERRGLLEEYNQGIVVC